MHRVPSSVETLISPRMSNFKRNLRVLPRPASGAPPTPWAHNKETCRQGKPRTNSHLKRTRNYLYRVHCFPPLISDWRIWGTWERNFTSTPQIATQRGTFQGRKIMLLLQRRCSWFCSEYYIPSRIFSSSSLIRTPPRLFSSSNSLCAAPRSTWRDWEACMATVQIRWFHEIAFAFCIMEEEEKDEKMEAK